MSEGLFATAIDRAALEQGIRQQEAAFQLSVGERHAHLFADVALPVSAAHLAQMQAVIAAVEQVVALPGWLT